MKTILSIIAVASILAAASSAQADFSGNFFETQQLFGENVDSDAIRTGQTLHPSGFLGAEAE